MGAQPGQRLRKTGTLLTAWMGWASRRRGRKPGGQPGRVAQLSLSAALPVGSAFLGEGARSFLRVRGRQDRGDDLVLL